jgi:hypothetical protein
VKHHRTHRRRSPAHFLLSVALSPHTNLHAYLMSRDKRDTLGAANRLLAEAAKLSNRVLPMVLATPLAADGVALVREIIASHSAEAKRLLQEASDFHITIFSTPEDAALMQLH